MLKVLHVYLSNADKPREMLEEHKKNSQIRSRRLVFYEFIEFSSNVPIGISANKP